jgi:hypothetical protein
MIFEKASKQATSRAPRAGLAIEGLIVWRESFTPKMSLKLTVHKAPET